MLFLPDPGNWPVTNSSTEPVVPREILNASASTASDQQMSLAAENAPLRLIYGEVTIGPQIACVLPYSGGYVILAVWSQGENDSITGMYLNNAASTLTATHYMGTAGQGVDSTLVAAFAAQSPSVTYTDALPGICYSVVVVGAKDSSGFPRLTAKIKGKKVWNGSTTAWSDNPAYCLSDFISSSVYGQGASTDWTSVASVAADCDALVGGTEKRRTLNLCLDTVQLVKNWIDTLRTYAGCWVVASSTGFKFVSDKVGSSIASYSHVSGNIDKISNIKKRGVQSTPTVMTVTFRDVTNIVPVDLPVVVVAPGGLPRRESQISLPGINRSTQAIREATERLNKLLYNDLSFTLSVFDDALAVDVGDIVDVTYPFYGFSAKSMRVMGVSGNYGRYDLSLVEYDPSVYSNSIATSPSFPDTILPNPTEPPAIVGVTMVEEVYKMESGVYSSRWRVTWTAVNYTYFDYYRAELWVGAQLIFSGSANSAEWVTPAIQEAITYTAKIAAVSSIGKVGTFGTQSGSALGKLIPPPNVNAITAFEAGGTVYATWAQVFDIDMWRYEIRYGAVGVAWAAATLLDRTDALRLQTDLIPTGTWTLHVRAMDSVGNYSAAAATCNVIVTSDASAFLVSSYFQTAPTLTNMVEYSLARDDTNRYFVTEDGVAWDTKFSAALNTYTNPLATYHNSVTSTWLGEGRDFGLLLGGQWTGTANVSDISGSHTSYLGNSTDGGSWTYPQGLSQKLNTRFARLKHEALTTSTLAVTIPTQSIRIDAIPRQENATGISSASGPVQVVLANRYVAAKKVNITAIGSTARSASVDNIQVGNLENPTFEVDNSGWSDLYSSGTFTRSTAQAHSGTASLLFNQASECVLGAKARSVTPGQVITMTAWVYCSVAVAAGLYARFVGSPTYPASGYCLWGASGYDPGYAGAESITTVVGWQQITASYTVPAGIYWISPSIWKWSPLNSTLTYVDDFVVTNLNTSLDAYVFNDSGTKIVSPFRIDWEGV